MSLIDHNFLGLLEMRKCGINTQAQKELVLKHASKHLNEDAVQKLNAVVQPQYLGWEAPEYERTSQEIKVIVFNHRPHEYKSYPWFLDMMDKLWKQRKDFRVWVPLAEAADREYIDIGMNSTRYHYLSHLSGCWMGVCGKQYYSGWSVSATDGLSVGVPYIFADETYYRELAEGAGLFFKTDEEFLVNANTLLDNPQLRLTLSKKGDERYKSSTWDIAIKPFNDMLQETFNSLLILKEPTDSYQQIVKFIKKNRSVTKADILDKMGWGVRIAFSSYRNRLRKEEGVVFTKNRYEYISN
jgi:glycosyltransferase involved in cell wall biosynthesis